MHPDIRFSLGQRSLILVALLALATNACSRGEPQATPEDAAKLARQLSALAGSGSQACAVFTREEIGAALGAKVREGTKWGIADGCEWAVDDENAVQLVIVGDPRYWEDGAKTPGGESLDGIGKAAFVAPWLGSFRAGVLTERETIYVMTPQRDLSVSLLRRALERIAP